MENSMGFVSNAFGSVSPRRRRNVVSHVVRPAPAIPENIRQNGLKRLKSRSWNSVRRWEKENELLFAMIEDESEWLGSLFPNDVIAPEFFFYALEDGVLLCKLAELVQKHAEMYAKKHKVTVPKFEIKYHQRARRRNQIGQFLARENVHTFLNWCRAHRIPEVILFESNDIVQTEELREGAREVVICLMEIARKAVKYGLKPPKLVLLENEIELEEKEEKVSASSEPIDLDYCCSSPSLSVDSGVETENESGQGNRSRRMDFDDIDGAFAQPSSPLKFAGNSTNEWNPPEIHKAKLLDGVNRILPDHPKPQSELDQKVNNFLR